MSVHVTHDPTRNLALELARVTEAAALAAGRFMGRGDKEAADGAAVHAMRIVLQTVDMNGINVNGEGEKDNAPMLYNGEYEVSFGAAKHGGKNFIQVAKVAFEIQVSRG